MKVQGQVRLGIWIEQFQGRVDMRQVALQRVGASFQVADCAGDFGPLTAKRIDDMSCGHARNVGSRRGNFLGRLLHNTGKNNKIQRRHYT